MEEQDEAEEMIPIDALPEEVLIRILQYLPKDSLTSVGLVCKAWHRIADDRQFWPSRFVTKTRKPRAVKKRRYNQIQEEDGKEEQGESSNNTAHYQSGGKILKMNQEDDSDEEEDDEGVDLATSLIELADFFKYQQRRPRGLLAND